MLLKKENLFYKEFEGENWVIFVLGLFVEKRQEILNEILEIRRNRRDEEAGAEG